MDLLPSTKPPVRGPIVLLGAILALGSFGSVLHKSSRVYLFQQAQCLNFYQTHDVSAIGANYDIEEGLCKLPIIQSRLSVVDGVDSFLQFLPPLLMLGIFKEILPQFGLRRLVILSLCCTALTVLYSILFFWLHESWTTEAVLLSFLFDLIGGGDLVRITIVCTCIAKISPAEELTNVYNYISASYFLSGVFGSAIGSLLLSHHVYILNGLSISVYLLTAYFASFIPSHYGLEDLAEDTVQPFLRSSYEDDSITSSQVRAFEPSLNPSKQIPLSQLALRSWRASYTSLLTLFSAPNPTFTVIILLFINILAVRIEVILPQYTSLALGWPLATVNRVLALKSLIAAASLFAIPTLRKAFLEPRYTNKGGASAIDLLITQTSLIANTIGIIGLGFSAGIPFFILALCVYTSGTGLSDSLTSYGTYTLPAGESVVEFYVRTGLITTVAALLGGLFWSAAFSYVVRSEWIPLGTPFWVCASLFGVGCVGVAALKGRG